MKTPFNNKNRMTLLEEVNRIKKFSLSPSPQTIVPNTPIIDPRTGIKTLDVIPNANPYTMPIPAEDPPPTPVFPQQSTPDVIPNANPYTMPIPAEDPPPTPVFPQQSTPPSLLSMRPPPTGVKPPVDPNTPAPGRTVRLKEEAEGNKTEPDWSRAYETIASNYRVAGRVDLSEYFAGAPRGDVDLDIIHTRDEGGIYDDLFKLMQMAERKNSELFSQAYKNKTPVDASKLITSKQIVETLKKKYDPENKLGDHFWEKIIREVSLVYDGFAKRRAPGFSSRVRSDEALGGMKRISKLVALGLEFSSGMPGSAKLEEVINAERELNKLRADITSKYSSVASSHIDNAFRRASRIAQIKYGYTFGSEDFKKFVSDYVEKDIKVRNERAEMARKVLAYRMVRAYGDRTAEKALTLYKIPVDKFMEYYNDFLGHMKSGMEGEKGLADVAGTGKMLGELSSVKDLGDLFSKLMEWLKSLFA